MQKKSYQVPLTIDEQISNLKDIGLIIDDEEAASAFLNDISYFRFIKAYSIGLKEKNGSYHEGITFGKLKELYLFNSRFRQVLFVQIERVEINLRCRVSNYFSCKYGNLGYEDAENFKDPNYHEQMMNDVQAEIERNKKAPYVRNFQNNYQGGKLPLYAAIELFSFGTLSKFFKNMKNTDKKAIASTYGVGYTYLESWIEHISFVRNICAHYGRLYNVNLAKTPSLYRQYTEQGVSNVRVFATLICLKYMLNNNNQWKNFVELIEEMFSTYTNVKQELMGFPKEWKALLN